jgi:hypothetical protein
MNLPRSYMFFDPKLGITMVISRESRQSSTQGERHQDDRKLCPRPGWRMLSSGSHFALKGAAKGRAEDINVRLGYSGSRRRYSSYEVGMTRCLQRCSPGIDRGRCRLRYSMRQYTKIHLNARTSEVESDHALDVTKMIDPRAGIPMSDKGL